MTRKGLIRCKTKIYELSIFNFGKIISHLFGTKCPFEKKISLQECFRQVWRYFETFRYMKGQDHFNIRIEPRLEFIRKRERKDAIKEFKVITIKGGKEIMTVKI